MTDAERIINMGIKITTKKHGELSVKELSLENLIKLSSDLILVFQVMTSDISTGRKEEGVATPLLSLARFLGNPELAAVARRVAAASVGLGEETFIDVGISDWLKWLNAFKEVMDWEQIKTLFFQLIPEARLKELWKQLISQQNSPISLTNLQVNMDGQLRE